MNTDRPSTRARGTVEFQGGPYDGLELVIAHLEKVACTIEVAVLEGGMPMMRSLLGVSDDERGRYIGYYQISPRPEGGDGQYHWQGGEGKPDRVGAVRWQ